MAQDSVFIEGMRVTAHIGVSSEERETRQVLRFDLELRCDLRRAGQSDEVGHTIDYGAVYQHVVSVVERTRCKLLEQLASRVADALLMAFPMCDAVCIRVGKPALFPTTGRSGMPGVELTRGRSCQGLGEPKRLG